MIFIGYYSVIHQVRKTITALEQKHNDALEQVKTQTSLLYLETYQHRKTSDELLNLRINDPLTQIYNHSYFQELLSNEIDRNKRYGTDFALLIIELDNFTKITNTYGHECGNFAMRKFSHLIGMKLRKSDLMTRYDGHDFAIITPNTGVDAAKHFADRLCREIEVADIYYEGIPLKITLSIGIGAPCVVEQLTPENLTVATEQALRLAIEKGRNQAVNV